LFILLDKQHVTPYVELESPHSGKRLIVEISLSDIETEVIETPWISIEVRERMMTVVCG